MPSVDDIAALLGPPRTATKQPGHGAGARSPNSARHGGTRPSATDPLHTQLLSLYQGSSANVSATNVGLRVATHPG